MCKLPFANIGHKTKHLLPVTLRRNKCENETSTLEESALYRISRLPPCDLIWDYQPFHGRKRLRGARGPLLLRDRAGILSRRLSTLGSTGYSSSPCGRTGPTS